MSKGSEGIVGNVASGRGSSASLVGATVPDIPATVPEFEYEADSAFGVLIAFTRFMSTAREVTMNRRTFLATTAAAATAATMKAASAATVTPFGQTAVPLRSTEPLPLGPLPGGRYPDSHLESLKKPQVSFGPAGFPAFAGTMAVERVATGFRWAEGPVCRPMCSHAVQPRPAASRSLWDQSILTRIGRYSLYRSD